MSTNMELVLDSSFYKFLLNFIDTISEDSNPPPRRWKLTNAMSKCDTASSAVSIQSDLESCADVCDKQEFDQFAYGVRTDSAKSCLEDGCICQCFKDKDCENNIAANNYHLFKFIGGNLTTPKVTF